VCSIRIPSATSLSLIGWSEPMSYRVSFFKNLLNSNGQQFSCLQQSIVIRRAKSVERAVEAAKRRFERLCLVAD
jgi:hypothetical protein